MSTEQIPTPASAEVAGTPSLPVGEFNHDVELMIADTKKMLRETTYRHGAPDSAVELSLATQVLLARKALSALTAANESLGKDKDRLDWLELLKVSVPTNFKSGRAPIYVPLNRASIDAARNPAKETKG